ncbi:hypothetical protein WKY82_00270 [Gordonia malaquae]|uniref:hypothetical protein n=1 Tax=Gordonia malaquae TaxID=410332 RepID=UPI0030C79F1B
MTSADQILATIENAHTRQMYTSRWNDFATYCHQVGATALPTNLSTFRDYLTEKAVLDPVTGEPRHAYSSIAITATAIRHIHLKADLPLIDDATGTRQHIHRGDGAAKFLEELKAHYANTSRLAGSPSQNRPLSTTSMRKLVAHSKHTASTWSERYTERRDTALLFAIAHMNIESKSVRTITPSSIFRGADGAWHVVSFANRNRSRIVRIPSESSVNLCGPCAWTRWMSVYTLRLRSGQAATIAALKGNDTLRHVCSDPVETDVPEGVEVVFPAHGTEESILRPVSGQTARKILQARLAPVLPAGTSITKYTLKSLATIANDLSAGHPLVVGL